MDQISKIQPQYRTMVDIAFERMQDAILSGELAAGQRVPQDAIAAELSISRMPLREALRRLEAGGFVTIVPHRGAIVTSASEDAVREMYFIRIVLETASARVAARRMDDHRIDKLRQLLERAREALEEERFADVADANRSFHLVGHEAAGLPRLHRMIDELSVHCHRYRLLHATLGGRANDSIEEHARILQAWERRDADAAEAAVRADLLNSEHALLTAIAHETVTAASA